MIAPKVIDMTAITSAADRRPAVEESWARIDAWLAEHAPLSRARLRPPAATDVIAEAERRLGVTFHPELVASLRCHDGVEPGEGAPAFALNGRFVKVSEIVNHSLFLRGIGEEFNDDYEGEGELDAYWRDEWLLLTDGVSGDVQDGLFLTCRAGDDYGRTGRYFNEDCPSFKDWGSLRAALSVFAESLERRLPIGGWVPLAFDGALIWEKATPTVKRQPTSLLEIARRTPERAPAPETEHAQREPEPPKAGGYFTLSFGQPQEPETRRPDLLFAEGVAPEELLLRAGVVQRETVRERTHDQAELSAASLWAASRPLVRAGRCGGWGFLLQSAGASQPARPEVLRRLARGTRLVALTKQGPDVRVTVYENGRPHARGDQDRLVSSPREDCVRCPGGAQAKTVGASPRPGSITVFAEGLAALQDGFGIDFDLERALDEPLLSGLVLPVLSDIPQWRSCPVAEIRHVALGALVERTPAPRLRAVMAAQLRRLARETGLDAYPEVTRALSAVDCGEATELTEDGALDLRIRTLVAEAAAARPALRPAWQRDRDEPEFPATQADFRAWQLRADAADSLRRFLQLPLPVAAASILHRRLSEDWRSELAHDLARSAGT